jgi:hypothetical protein
MVTLNLTCKYGTGAMSLLDVHTCTIENTELDRSILNSLKASGNAMKSLMTNNPIQKVEVRIYLINDIILIYYHQLNPPQYRIKSTQETIMDAEIQMDAAAEMNKVINSSSMLGVLNSMVSSDTEMSIDPIVL